MRYARVKVTTPEKDVEWRGLFQKRHLHFPPGHLLILACKREATLEVWASDGEAQNYLLLKPFRICASSGALGPKRRYREGQVPERRWRASRDKTHSNLDISPRLTNDGYRALAERHRGDAELASFWGNLKEVFDFFEQEHQAPSIRVSQDGRYHFGP